MERNIVLNLTQHVATKEQKESGVIDLPENYRNALTTILTFDDLPDIEEILTRSLALKTLVLNFLEDEPSPMKKEVLEIKENGNYKDLGLSFMIGGAPFFMSAIERELWSIGTPLYAFSKRESIEKEIDGVVRKINTFRHLGFVEALPPC